MSNKYIFINDLGNFIALDSASGGYPYETDNLFKAHPFYTISEAQRYYDTMSASRKENEVSNYARVLTWRLYHLADQVRHDHSIHIGLNEIKFDRRFE